MAEIHKHEALQARIDRLPRVGLAHLPTPLEFCPNLTAALGGPKIYLKRDDLTGFAFGGNKSRQLEFLFADILARRVDVVVAGGSTQSNWCRQIGAAAAKFGLRAALVLVPGAEPLAAQGNLLLDRLVDAEVSVMESGEVEDLPELLATKAQALQAEGATPFVLSQFDLDAQSLSAVGYVEAAIELDRQFREAAIVWNAEGGRYCATEIARIAAATAHRLGLDIEVPITDIISDESFVGAGYGILSPAAREAIELVAGTEGVFLDPIYTAKAMAALIDHVRAGRFAAGESVVFLHTGGTPALFAYATDFATG
jgi:1-aminocyclopropane-1-carboxylate deaminase/D-cysteine desulfhydrase-like pyridoxal-dependent ACC family enzyme